MKKLLKSTTTGSSSSSRFRQRQKRDKQQGEISKPSGRSSSVRYSVLIVILLSLIALTYLPKNGTSMATNNTIYNIKSKHDNDNDTGNDLDDDDDDDNNGQEGTTSTLQDQGSVQPEEKQQGEEELWEATTSRGLIYYGYYEPVDNDESKKRLVVYGDAMIGFWVGQKELCDLLVQINTKNNNRETTKSALTLGSIEQQEQVQKNFFQTHVPRPLLNITINCHSALREGLGQGNWITAWYNIQMATSLAQVDLLLQCHDHDTSYMELLLPWVSGYIPAQQSINPWPYSYDSSTPPTEREACASNYKFFRIDKMVRKIIDDMRKMAVSLVGSQEENPSRAHPDVPRDQAPLIPDVVLDDVVIHFRCGDVMGGASRNDFGMIKFNSYKQYIDKKNTKSIGIVTQPFMKDHNRDLDKGRVDQCKEAVMTMVDYLHSFLDDDNGTDNDNGPVRITIHNDPKKGETLPLTYARLIMAKQAFVSLSSFGIFPVLGTFGQGYFQQGNPGVNPWANHIVKEQQQHLDNIHMMTGPVLGTGTIGKMKFEDVLEWFVTD